MAPLWRLSTDVLAAEDHAEAAREFLRRLDSDCRAAAVASALLPARVLTISRSSSVLEALGRRRPATVVCMRSDPGGEGVRLASELASLTAASVISDEDAIRRVPSDAVLTGADAVTPTVVVNKIKTRRLAEAATAKGIPCYAVAGFTKFVGAELPLEATLDATPLELFAGIAAPRGVLSPEAAGRDAVKAALHADLLPLLQQLR